MMSSTLNLYYRLKKTLAMQHKLDHEQRGKNIKGEKQLYCSMDNLEGINYGALNQQLLQFENLNFDV